MSRRMNVVAVVDYGLCNVDSVARAVEECGGKPIITNQIGGIETATRIILPGVGVFSKAMRNLKQQSLDIVLKHQVLEEHVPILGICLGMQLLATKGWEIEETAGLGLVPGEVRPLKTFGEDIRVPHIGWNEVHLVRESPLLKNIPSGKDFYFVHSYCLYPNEEQVVLGRTPYGEGFVSVIQNGLAFGTQFHPEKSQRLGFQVIKNFLVI